MTSTPAKQNKLKLPRGYLSWSAMNTFVRSKEEYIRHYFYGEPQSFSNHPSVKFGSEFAKHLEKRDKKHSNPVVEMAVHAMPRLPKPEHKISADLPSEWGDIPIIGTLDQYDPKTHEFSEFKTGSHKWTQTTAQNHGQMKFYSLILWLNHGVIENKKSLIWVETMRIGDQVRPTGRIETYPVIISLSDLLVFGNTVIEVAKQISDLYEEEINRMVP